MGLNFNTSCQVSLLDGLKHVLEEIRKNHGQVSKIFAKELSEFWVLEIIRVFKDIGV